MVKGLLEWSSLSVEEQKALRNIARGLKVFTAQWAFGYIDKLANVFSIESLRQILYEFLWDLSVGNLKFRSLSGIIARLKLLTFEERIMRGVIMKWLSFQQVKL